MNNATILIKVKNRLTKISSNDYSNLASWTIVEAFNKAQLEWCRRNLHGSNIRQEGADQSISRIEDFEVLLTTSNKLKTTDKGIYGETSNTVWPSDFLRYERISLTVTKECCPEPKRMKVYLGEEANVDIYLSDVNKKPDYAWGYTFAVLGGNKIKVYHDNQFDLEELKLIYYRNPNPIQINGITNLNTGALSTVNVECEFNEDLCELLVDAAADILAADTDNWNQKNRLSESVEKNN